MACSDLFDSIIEFLQKAPPAGKHAIAVGVLNMQHPDGSITLLESDLQYQPQANQLIFYRNVSGISPTLDVPADVTGPGQNWTVTIQRDGTVSVSTGIILEDFQFAANCAIAPNIWVGTAKQEGVIAPGIPPKRAVVISVVLFSANLSYVQPI
jgi:hypothetical protein